MDKQDNPIRKAVDAIGGYTAAGRICGVSYNAVIKWCDQGLPFTELSGHTNYAVRLANASKTVSVNELISTVYSRTDKRARGAGATPKKKRAKA